jgi:hypothetical protein
MGEYNSIEECLEAVRRDGYNLQYIREENQTEEICMEAIRNDASSIRFVKRQTARLCGEAIKVGLYEWEYLTLKYDGKDVIGTPYRKEESMKRDDGCPICLDDWCEEDTEENVVKCPCCLHHFHMKCIDKWVCSSNNKCPYCKSHKWINYLTCVVWFEEDTDNIKYELGSTPLTVKGTIFEEQKPKKIAYDYDEEVHTNED